MWLGKIAWVQQNLETIVFAVIIISILPMVIAGIIRWRKSRHLKQEDIHRRNGGTEGNN
jgi:hypothetical protein